jgi:hypothetical protein
VAPLVAAAIAYLVQVLREAAVAAVLDAQELTDEERARRVLDLLTRAELLTVEAEALRELGHHRRALLAARRAVHQSARAARLRAGG